MLQKIEYYCMLAIITSGLYISNPLFEGLKLFMGCLFLRIQSRIGYDGVHTLLVFKLQIFFYEKAEALGTKFLTVACHWKFKRT